jgi:hypothetical protein
MHPDQATQASLKQWARGGQFKPKMDSDEACLQCHQPMRTQISAHSHHSIESPGSRCYNCHMPRTTYGLLHAMRSHQVSNPNVKESVDYGRPNACNLCHLNQTLAWTADKLHTWYNQPIPALSDDDQKIAASVLWILKGDAGQRALISWGMGWKPAQEISGNDWLYPYLIYALTDRYPAVRFDAWKSLQTLPGFEGFAYNYTDESSASTTASLNALDHWSRDILKPTVTFPAETVLDQQGSPDSQIFERLRSQRDDKPIILAE